MTDYAIFTTHDETTHELLKVVVYKNEVISVREINKNNIRSKDANTEIILKGNRTAFVTQKIDEVNSKLAS